MATASAIPPTLDLSLYAGDDVTLTLTVTDKFGNPVDLTGTLEAQIRKAHAQPVIQSFEVNTVTPASGVCYLTLTNVQTEALGLDGGRHTWDLQLTDDNDLISSVCKGQVSTTLDITHSGEPL